MPALRGKTVVSLFFEDSTRTRLSFETAAKRLSRRHDELQRRHLGSVNKGESLRDTVETIEAMGVDAFVVRHESAGVPWQIASWADASVINAGDGWHEHPTQALLDCYTIRTALGRVGFDGLHIAIVGDIKHSRGRPQRTCSAFTALGAEVTLVAPPTLLPPSLDGWPVDVSHDLDDVLPKRRRRLPAAHAARAHDRGAAAVSCASTPPRYGLTRRARRAAAASTRWSCTRVR